jgi:site-specific DNA recombinase
MPQTILLPNGKVLVMPELPTHHHDGPCSCVPAAGYVRVSDVHGRGPDEFVAPELQVDSMIPWCRLNNRRLVKLIFDIDKSGQTFDGRIESVRELLEGCERGTWRTVTMWKWSRWSRDAAEALHWLKVVEKAGGEVRACTEDVDPTHAKAKLLRGLHLLLAEDRGDEISEGWRATHRNRRKNGMPHSGRARFGYDYRPIAKKDIEDWPESFVENDLGRRRYIPHPETGPLLVAGYERYIVGESLRSIVRDWNFFGARTTLGKRWTPQSLGKMLDTGFAAGYIRYRTNPPRRAPANKLSSYDGWAEGNHPALIAREIWQSYRSRREAQADLPARTRTAVHTVSGLLYCGLCGCRISTKYQGRNKTHQWVCQARTGKHPGAHVGVSNEMILGLLKSWAVDREPKNYRESVEVETQRLVRLQEATINLEQIQTELDQIEKRNIPNLIRLHMRSSITDNEFDMMKAEQETAARTLRLDLKAAQAKSAESQGQLEMVIKSLAEDWEVYRQNPAGHRELLSTVISGVVISPGRGKIELPSRVKVYAAWESDEFEAAVLTLRSAAS